MKNFNNVLGFMLAVCCCWIFGSSASAQVGLEDIIVEEYYVSTAADAVPNFGVEGPEEGSVTYRIYADLAPGWRLLQVVGYTEAPLQFNTTTGFYNAGQANVEFASGFGPFNSFAPAILDSYFALGRATSSSAGIPKEDDPNGSIYTNPPYLQGTIAPVNVNDGLVPVTADQNSAAKLGVESFDVVNVNGANSLFAINTTWQNLNGSQGIGDENKVLIAQLTTTGELSFSINIQLTNNTGASPVIEIYTHSPVTVDLGFSVFSSPALIFPQEQGDVEGCITPTACNFNALATIDDGTCIIPVENCSVCNATDDGLDIVDTDQDGVCNLEDECPLDGNKTAPGQCGCGVVDTDSDNDGTADCNDGCPQDMNKTEPGSCGCGVVDTDSDSDGLADCVDACPDDPAKTTDEGICGCGESDDDTNGNGVADCNDVAGCTNPAASNFDELANLDDGSCEFGQFLACDGELGGLENIIVEEYYTSTAEDAAEVFGVPGPEEGSVTYRIYADMAPGYRVISIVGFAQSALEISTTTDFYNATGANATVGSDFGPFSYFGAVPLDSYLSLGQTGPGTIGVPKPEDTNGSIFTDRLQGTINPINVLDGNVPADGNQNPAAILAPAGVTFPIVNVNGAGSLSETNAGWFNLNGSRGVAPENKVLIGQFTTTGEFSFKLNIQISNNDVFPILNEVYSHIGSFQNGDSFTRTCAALVFPEVPLVMGCTDDLACNFDQDAVLDDGSCLIPAANCSECSGQELVLIDTDDDGVCDAEEGPGCTDVLACNFDITVDAGNDDGSCIVPEAGCTACNATNDALILIDADGDGTCDLEDGCPNDTNKLSPGTCGCGVADVDSDFDGVADCIDGCPDDMMKTEPGVCGCNVSDEDSDSDGVADCNDLCPLDPLKTAPGACGCGTEDTDSDGDGTPDCIDLCPDLADLEPGDPCTVDGTGEEGFLSSDCSCNPGPKPACTSPVACNFFDVNDPANAGISIFSAPELCDEPVDCKECLYGPGEAYGLGNGESFFPDGTDTNGNMVCDIFEASGCTSMTACNFDPAAVNDDGSCVEPALNCVLCIESFPYFIFIDSDGDGVCNAEEVLGCTNPTACNFDADATQNDGSCLHPEPGCSVCSDGGLVSIDTDGDQTPDCEEIFGCTVEGACNFNADATEDNGSCLFAEENCSRCLNVFGQWVLLPIDNDGDGVCNADEVPGCDNPLACNFNPDATENDGSCLVPQPGCIECDENGNGLLIADADLDGICDLNEVPGCTSNIACNFNPAATDEDGSCVFETPGCTVCLSNGTLALQDNDGDGVCNLEDPDDDNDGCEDLNDPQPYVFSTDSDGDGVGDACDICSGDDASGDTDGDGICDDSEVPGCTDVTACNFDATATDDNGSCVVPVENCLACNDFGGLTLVDSDGDKICDADEIPGCTDELACNYNADATDDDGSCLLPVEDCIECKDGGIILVDVDGDGICDADEVPGCTSETACNFNPLATDDNDSCNEPVEDCLACGANGQLVLVDADNDGICDALEVPGCTNQEACNYNADATDDDGSCLIPVADCTKCEVENGVIVLGPVDNDGDGICDADEVPGCLDPIACNYNPEATDEAECIIPTEDCTQCGTFTLPNGVVVAGLVIIDTDGDKVCDADEVLGCDNSAALNFDPLATEDDGSCIFDCEVPEGCESFEVGLGSWTNRTSDDIDWTSISGATPSGGTGPDAAFEGSSYVYVEASYPNFPNKVAELESPCYDISEISQVSFAYHMKGRFGSVGTLQLQASVTDAQGGQTTFTPIWTITGNQGANWNTAQVQLPALAIGGSIQFRLVATTAGSFLGDIAVDNFCIQSVIEGCTDVTASNYDPAATVDDGSCSFLSCANERQLPYCTSFNQNFSGFSQGVNGVDDAIDWLQATGPTASMYTGPSAANSGLGYIYVEASAPNNPFKDAEITSPCIDLTDELQNPDPAVSFAYHMFGEYVGQLMLEVSMNGVDWDLIWFAQGNHGDQWLDESISLQAYNGHVVRLRFTGVTFNGWQGDMAIDDFCVTNDPTASPLMVIKPTEIDMISAMSKEGIEFQESEFANSVEEFEFTLYPNPSNLKTPVAIALFNIPVDAEDVMVRITDMTGRQVEFREYAVSGSSMMQQIELEQNLANGVYLVHVIAGEEARTERLLIAQ